MEDKNVQKLLDMLFGMIDEAKGATFSSEKCVINRDEALDLLDEIRNKLPGELTKAQELMKSKEQYVDKANHEVRRMLDQAQDEAKRLREQAQAEAKRMLEKAQEDAKTIVSESETIQRAQRRSSEIIRQAEDRSRQLYQVANTYTEDALRRTEEAIQAAQIRGWNQYTATSRWPSGFHQWSRRRRWAPSWRSTLCRVSPSSPEGRYTRGRKMPRIKGEEMSSQR